jgi:hypothetical protein
LIVLFFRYNKKTLNLNKKIKEKLGKISSDKEGKKMLGSEKSKINNAESSPVIQGTKEISSVITLKIKTPITSFIRESVERILGNTKKENIAIDFRDNEAIIILSPRKTRTFQNEYPAMKVATQIQEALENHNKKFKEKIDFGIGINSGDIISSLEKDKLKYTGIGDTISFSKKISSISNGEILISEKLRNKLSRDVKAERMENERGVYYKILNLEGKENNKEKLRDLLKRTHLD